MGKFDGVLLLSDYDDTLIGQDLTIPPRNLRALERFMAEGGTFSVATGRGYQTFLPLWRGVPMNGPTVVSNGAAIYDYPQGRWIFASCLSGETARRLEQLIERFSALAIEVYTKEIIYVWNYNDFVRQHQQRVKAEMVPRAIREMKGGWLKVLFQGERPLLEEVQAYIQTRWPGDYEVIFSGYYLLELTGIGVNKGAAALRLAGQLGIARESLYCIGDNQNDLSMLLVSAIPFAPSNCIKELKVRGAMVLCSCDEGCIADVITVLEARY